MLAFNKNSQGWRVVQAEECWHKSVDPLMEEIREQMGTVMHRNPKRGEYL